MNFLLKRDGNKKPFLKLKYVIFIFGLLFFSFSGIWIESPSFKDKGKVLHLSQPSGRANVVRALTSVGVTIYFVEWFFQMVYVFLYLCRKDYIACYLLYEKKLWEAFQETFCIVVLLQRHQPFLVLTKRVL